MPAIVYYLGAAFAAALLVLGLRRCLRGRECAILAGAGAVVLLYVAARIGGTPYTSAKAIERRRRSSPWRSSPPGRAKAGGRSGLPIWAYLAAAGFCSLLALANAPVGPSSYSPALTGLRPLIASGSTLVLAPRQLLDEEHGERYLDWELRGGRVCVADEDDPPAKLPDGVALVITSDERTRPPFPGVALAEEADPYLLWARPSGVTGPGPCPLIAVRQARQGPAG